MSHFFERSWIWAMLYFGGSIVVATDGVNNFADNLKTVKPTFLVSIPKVFTKIYSSIKNEIEKQSAVKRKMLNKAIASKLK